MLVQEKVPTTVKLRSHDSWVCFHVWLLMYCSSMPCSTCLCVPLSLECLAFLFVSTSSLLRTSSTRTGYCHAATLGVTPLHLFLWMKISNLVVGLGHWMIISSELLTSLHRHSKCSVFLLQIWPGIKSLEFGVTYSKEASLQLIIRVHCIGWRVVCYNFLEHSWAIA